MDGQDELFVNLVYARDEECEDPLSVPDSEVKRIAEWAWCKRLEGKVYHGRNSEFRIRRTALDALTGAPNMSDALALYTVLTAIHGHQPGKAFKLIHAGMQNAGHTDLSRRRFLEARRTLERVGLLRLAKRHSSSRRAQSYQLCRPHQPAGNTEPLG